MRDKGGPDLITSTYILANDARIKRDDPKKKGGILQNLISSKSQSAESGERRKRKKTRILREETES